MNYWNECIAEAFDSAEIKATQEQIDEVAGWAEGAHENYGMAFGHDCIPNPQTAEIESLQRELKKERSKVHCEPCNGTGRIITPGPVHSSNSGCAKCGGEGRHSL